MNLEFAFNFQDTKQYKKDKRTKICGIRKEETHHLYLSYVTESGKVTNRMFLKHVVKTCMSINLFHILIPCVTRNLSNKISGLTLFIFNSKLVFIFYFLFLLNRSQLNRKYHWELYLINKLDNHRHHVIIILKDLSS